MSFHAPPRPCLRVELLEDRTLPSTSIPLNPVHWTNLGPAPIVNGQTPGGQPVTGRLAGIAAHPTDANIIYVAAAGGGVWKTTNAGASWTPLTDDQPTLFMGALALAPSDPNILYAGTGESTNSGLSFYGRGVLRSSDAGETWTLLGNSVFDRKTIAEIVVHPTIPELLYVAVASPGVNGVAGNTGIWKSSDGGATWTNTTASITTVQHFSDVEMDPTNPNVLYAAIGTSNVSPLNGVYKTSDAGLTWAVAGDFPLAGSDPSYGRVEIALARSSPATLYASIHNRFGGLLRMLKSTDAGATWTTLAGVPDYLGNGSYHHALIVDPTDANVVYAAGFNPIKSSNGGASWNFITVGADGGGPHVDHHALGFDALGRLLDGNDGGIWRLDNPNVGSIHWTNLNNNLSVIQYIGIAIHPTNPDIAFGGSQDNGTSKFNDSLGWTLVRGGDGGFTRIDRSSPSTVYSTFQYPVGPIFLARSDDGGATWTPKTNGINTSDGGNFYIPYVMDPADSSRLLLGTNRVYETVNRGDLWTPLSTPNQNGWLGVANINSVSAAATDFNTIYAATFNLIFVTFNHGASWTPRALPGGLGNISEIQVDPTDSLVAYVVRTTFGGGKVWRTSNGGATWTDITGNLPDLPAYTIEIKPNGPGSGDDVLYIGNDNGVWVSTNLGAGWSRLGTGMPNVAVRDLELNRTLGILAAGTHGRGLWELIVRRFTVVPQPLGPGEYEPLVTWVARAANATQATDPGWDGSILRGTLAINPQDAPNGTLIGGTRVESLGTVQTMTLLSEPSSLANDDVVADPDFDPVEFDQIAVYLQRQLG